MLTGVDRSLVRAYAVVVAAPLLLLAAVPAVIVWSRVEGEFRHLPLWAVVPVQVLALAGVALIGRRLRADPYGQLRFGAYAAVFVSAGLGMFLTHETVVVGAVGLGSLAVVLAVDLAAGRR
jgi:hypothetical protein